MMCVKALLDKDPVELAISNELFTMLKQSNVGRFTLLASLLTRLGLNCDKSAAPPLSSVCLLTQSKVCLCQSGQYYLCRAALGSGLGLVLLFTAVDRVERAISTTNGITSCLSGK